MSDLNDTDDTITLDDVLKANQELQEENLRLHDKLEEIEWRLGEGWKSVATEFEATYPGVDATFESAVAYLLSRTEELQSQVQEMEEKETYLDKEIRLSKHEIV